MPGINRQNATSRGEKAGTLAINVRISKYAVTYATLNVRAPVLTLDVPSVSFVPQNPASQGGEGSQRENLLPVPRHTSSFFLTARSHTRVTHYTTTSRMSSRAPLSCARRHVSTVRPHLMVSDVPLKYSFTIRHRRRTADSGALITFDVSSFRDPAWYVRHDRSSDDRIHTLPAHVKSVISRRHLLLSPFLFTAVIRAERTPDN